MNECQNEWIKNRDTLSLAIESDNHSVGVYSIFNQNVKFVFHISVTLVESHNPKITREGPFKCDWLWRSLLASFLKRSLADASAEFEWTQGKIGHEFFQRAYSKLREATINFVMFVRPFVPLSARNNSAPNGRIFI